MSEIVEAFKYVYQSLDRNNIGSIDKIYEDDVVFVDPFREIRGLSNLKHYFTDMYEGVSYCRFQFTNTLIQKEDAAVLWTMELVHPKLGGGKKIIVPGSSYIVFSQKIEYHRDYFDAAAMLYENIPLIGRIIKRIKANV